MRRLRTGLAASMLLSFAASGVPTAVAAPVPVYPMGAEESIQLVQFRPAHRRPVVRPGVGPRPAARPGIQGRPATHPFNRPLGTIAPGVAPRPVVRPPAVRPGLAARPVTRSHFERRGRVAYYNRYRGYPYYRHGYRRYNGWWFPPAAFIGGAIIGGAIASPPVVVAPAVPAYGLSAAHVEWCRNRWRSYRVSDNSYQPYHGPRRVCVSPYGP